MLVTFKIICMYFLGLHTPAFCGHLPAIINSNFLLLAHFFLYLGQAFPISLTNYKKECFSECWPSGHITISVRAIITTAHG